MMYDYFFPTLSALIERVTDSEFNSDGWNRDPDMDVYARDWRDIELCLDMSGNLDSEL